MRLLFLLAMLVFISCSKEDSLDDYRPLSFEEASKAVPFQLKKPKFLPDGINPSPNVRILTRETDPNQTVTEVSIYYQYEETRKPYLMLEIRNEAYSAGGGEGFITEEIGNIIVGFYERTFLFSTTDRSERQGFTLYWNQADLYYNLVVVDTSKSDALRIVKSIIENNDN